MESEGARPKVHLRKTASSRLRDGPAGSPETPQDNNASSPNLFDAQKLLNPAHGLKALWEAAATATEPLNPFAGEGQRDGEGRRDIERSLSQEASSSHKQDGETSSSQLSAHQAAYKQLKVVSSLSVKTDSPSLGSGDKSTGSKRRSPRFLSSKQRTPERTPESSADKAKAQEAVNRVRSTPLFSKSFLRSHTSESQDGRGESGAPRADFDSRAKFKESTVLGGDGVRAERIGGPDRRAEEAFTLMQPKSAGPGARGPEPEATKFLSSKSRVGGPKAALLSRAEGPKDEESSIKQDRGQRGDRQRRLSSNPYIDKHLQFLISEVCSISAAVESEIQAVSSEHLSALSELEEVCKQVEMTRGRMSVGKLTASAPDDVETLFSEVENMCNEVETLRSQNAVEKERREEAEELLRKVRQTLASHIEADKQKEAIEREKFKDLQTNLEKEKSKRIAAEKQIHSLSTSRSAQEEGTERANKEIQRLKTELQGERDCRKRMEQSLKELRETRAEDEKGSVANKIRIQELEVERLSNIQKLTDLENSLSRQTNALEDEQSKRSEAESAKKLEAERNTGLELEISGLRTQMQAVQASAAGARSSELEELSKIRKQLQSSLTERLKAEDEISRLKAEIEDYKNAKLSAESDISNTRKLVSDVQKEMLTLKSKFQDKASKCEELETTNINLQYEVDTKSKEISELQTQTAANMEPLQAELARAQQELEDEKAHRSDAESSVKELNQALELQFQKEKIQMKQKNKLIQELEQTRAALKTEAATAVRLKERSESKESNAEAEKQRVEHDKAQVLQWQSEVKELRALQAEQEKQFAKESDKMQEENTLLRQQLAELKMKALAAESMHTRDKLPPRDLFTEDGNPIISQALNSPTSPLETKTGHDSPQVELQNKERDLQDANARLEKEKEALQQQLQKVLQACMQEEIEAEQARKREAAALAKLSLLSSSAQKQSPSALEIPESGFYTPVVEKDAKTGYKRKTPKALELSSDEDAPAPADENGDSDDGMEAFQIPNGEWHLTPEAHIRHRAGKLGDGGSLNHKIVSQMVGKIERKTSQKD